MINLKNAPSGLSNLKCKVDKLDTGKLATTQVDLCKLSDVVKNEVVKKTEYNELVTKVNNSNNTDTTDLVEKIDCNTKVNQIDKKWSWSW